MEAYYDPKKGFSNAYALYKGQDVKTLTQVKDAIKKYEPYQLNKQLGHITYFPTLGHGKHSYSADLMILDNDGGYNNILCIINMITRVAYAYPQKSKTAEETVGNLKKFYTAVPNVEHLQTDAGGEFDNRQAQALFKDIDYYHLLSKTAQGRIERFNQTLRRLITLYQSAYKTTKWVDVLPDLVYNYNHRYHKSLGCAPIDANEDEQYNKEMKQYDAADYEVTKYKVGDKVRILENKDLFDKGRAQWSHIVYRIEKIDGHRMIVNGEAYQYYQLQKIAGVHTKLFDSNEVVDKVAIKKDKKIVRDLRKEGVGAYNKPGAKEIEVRGKRERVLKMDASLIGRRIDRGDGETGKITKYDPVGDYKWYVKYDKKAKNDFELMDAAEVRKFIVS